MRCLLRQHHHHLHLGLVSATTIPWRKAAPTRMTGININRTGGQVRWTAALITGDGAPIKIVFEDKDGTEKIVNGKVGGNLLKAAQDAGVELEGACEGSVACSTCHVVLEKHIYDALPTPSEDEDDMLDMAFGLTSTSRLSCEVTMDQTMNGMKVIVPKATRNFYVDGHKPKPH